MTEFLEIGNDGLSLLLSTYGASMVSVFYSDKEGNVVDCILGFDTKKEYLADTANLGRTIGRVCNRIRDGKFTFHGQDYQLPINLPPHCLHGGPNGLGVRDWELIRHSNNSATLRIRSDETIDQFPGDVTVEVTYTVNDLHQIIVQHFATCTRPGILSLTNHAYWNLDGSDTVHNHVVQVRAHEYLPIDETCCASGGQLLVKTTKFDLNDEKPLHSLRDVEGFVDIDHDLVLDPTIVPGNNVLSLFSPLSGIRLDVATSYPAIHLYGAKFLNTTGKKHIKYGPNKGLAIEPQFFSTSANYSHFPSIELVPERPYAQEIIYSLSRS